MFTKRAALALYRRLLGLKHHHQKYCMSDHHGDVTLALSPSFTKTPPLSQVRTKDADILSDQLQKAKSVDRLFEIVTQHQNVMNNSQILAAFTSLCEATRQHSQETVTADIIVHPSFRELCNRALKRMRFYSTDDALTLLKITTNLGIPANTMLVQAVCQMLRHSINSFSLQQLMFLDHLLSRQNGKSSLTEALKMAVPLVFQTQAPIQLDFSSAADVSQCFCFAVNKGVDAALIEKLAVCLMSHMPNMNAEDAAKLVLSTSLSNQTAQCFSIPGIRELIVVAQSIVATSLSKFPQKAVRAFIACFRNGVFLKDVAKAVVKKCLAETWEPWELSILVAGCIRCDYASPELSEMVAERVLKDPSIVQNDMRVSVLTLTEGIAACPQRNQTFKEAAHVLASCQEKLEMLKFSAPHLYVKAAADLAALQCFPKEMLDEVFGEEFLNATKFKVSERNRPFLLKHLLRLEQGVRTELKSYEGSLLPDILRNEAMEIAATESKIFLPLKKGLEAGIGGPQFLKSALWTHHGYFIDFVIVMRKGEFPVAINNNPVEGDEKNTTGYSFVEDLVTPADSKILVVVAADGSCFWRNTSVLKGHVVTKLRCLSLLGYCPVLVRRETGRRRRDERRTARPRLGETEKKNRAGTAMLIPMGPTTKWTCKTLLHRGGDNSDDPSEQLKGALNVI